MTRYTDRLRPIIQKIDKNLVDLELAHADKSAPTQASSEFVTNREQGDWAEAVLTTAINALGKDLVAVKYGRSDRLVAGEEGFTEFYASYQSELSTIGKRPDVLIFRTGDYDYDWGYDISEFSLARQDLIVPKAIAAFEVRSSAFLIDVYEEDLKRRVSELKERASELRDILLANHRPAFKPAVLAELAKVDLATFEGFPERVYLSRNADGIAARNLWDELRGIKRRLVDTRDFLSFTPKNEDLAAVWRWVRRYDVPHFYVQVFFDRVYGIGLEHILTLLADPANEGKRFFVERDIKNQGKTTFKVNVKDGYEVAGRIVMPEHKSNMLMLPRGRLLFYVSFEGGTAFLNVGNLKTLVGVQ